MRSRERAGGPKEGGKGKGGGRKGGQKGGERRLAINVGDTTIPETFALQNQGVRTRAQTAEDTVTMKTCALPSLRNRETQRKGRQEATAKEKGKEVVKASISREHGRMEKDSMHLRRRIPMRLHR